MTPKITEEIKARLFGLYVDTDAQIRSSRSVAVLTSKYYSEFISEKSENWHLFLRSINSLTSQNIDVLGKKIGLVNLKIVERDADCIFCVDDSYTIGLYSTGVITMYKGTGLHIKPYWNDIQIIVDVLRSEGVFLPYLGMYQEFIDAGVVKLREDGV